MQTSTQSCCFLSSAQMLYCCRYYQFAFVRRNKNWNLAHTCVSQNKFYLLWHDLKLPLRCSWYQVLGNGKRCQWPIEPSAAQIETGVVSYFLYLQMMCCYIWNRGHQMTTFWNDYCARFLLSFLEMQRKPYRQILMLTCLCSERR